MIRPAPSDPPSIDPVLWAGWHGGVGWDIGSNVGQSIKHMTEAFSRVHAFEPNPDTLNVLIACEFEDWGVTVHPIAVSDHDGTVILAAIPRLLETGQLITPGTHDVVWDPDSGWNSIPHVTIPCRSVDSLAYDLGIPDFIKVDTEGHEGVILDGARHLIELAQTDWLIEFHTPELHGYCSNAFEAESYTVETIRHPHYAPNSEMWHTHGWIRVTHQKEQHALSFGPTTSRRTSSTNARPS